MDKMDLMSLKELIFALDKALLREREETAQEYEFKGRKTLCQWLEAHHYMWVRQRCKIIHGSCVFVCVCMSSHAFVLG